MAYIRCQNYILLLTILYAILVLYSATCMVYSATYCPLMQYSYCIMLNECPIRLHVIRKFDISLRYIDIIFCEMNCQFANMRGS